MKVGLWHLFGSVDPLTCIVGHQGSHPFQTARTMTAYLPYDYMGNWDPLVSKNGDFSHHGLGDPSSIVIEAFNDSGFGKNLEPQT